MNTKIQKENANTYLHKLVLVYLLLFISSSVTLASSRTLSESTTWKRLLHLKDGKSSIDGEGFFLYKGKDWTAEKELTTTVEFLSKNIKIGRLGLHPQCSFPERYRYLKQNLKLKIKDVECRTFKAWKKGISADAITLVFASSFPNNPASLFGHTFIKFNNRKNGSELLDYALNYAAATGNDGAIPFAMFGLFGFYEGHYTISPYYLKLNEYSSFENRDLWEYELNFTKSEIDSFLNHIWEIEANSHSWYYFLDENCSYQLLTLFEILREDIVLSEGFGPYVNPVDTIKSVKKAGLIKNVKYRPSLRKRFFEQFRRLDSKSEESFFDLIENSKDASPPTEALDAAILYFKHKKLKKRGKLSTLELKNFSRLLSLKTKKPVSTLAKPVVPPSPEHGHDSRSVSLSFKGSKPEKAIIIQGKLGMHDLLNNDTGYIPFSSIDVMDLSLQYDSKRKFALDRLTIINAKSFDPFSFLEKSFSFGFDVTYRRSQFTTSENRYLGEANLFGGLATDFLGANTRLYCLLNIFSYTRDLYLGLSVIPGLLVDWGFGKTHIYVKPYYSFTKKMTFVTYHTELSLFARKNLEYSIKVRYFDKLKELSRFADDHFRFTLKAQYFF